MRYAGRTRGGIWKERHRRKWSGCATERRFLSAQERKPLRSERSHWPAGGFAVETRSLAASRIPAVFISKRARTIND